MSPSRTWSLFYFHLIFFPHSINFFLFFITSRVFYFDLSICLSIYQYFVPIYYEIRCISLLLPLHFSSIDSTSDMSHFALVQSILLIWHLSGILWSNWLFYFFIVWSIRWFVSFCPDILYCLSVQCLSLLIYQKGYFWFLLLKLYVRYHIHI